MPERESAPEEGGQATAERGSVLEELAREGARKMLQTALLDEVREHLARYEQLLDEQGHRLVVGNRRAPERTILTGVGP
jgi:hypothetical protein